MTFPHAAAPQPSYRLVPSRFPPIGLFDTVATPADLEAVMELVGWTNDRLVADRIARLPSHEWIYGRSNASVVMATFLHVAPMGSRFNALELGAWYAGDDVRTSAAEVGHHLRRETVARQVPQMARTFRTYAANLQGDYLDIRGQQEAMPDVYASDRYDASQAFGEAARARGEAGIFYDSLRRRGGSNVAAYRPSNVVQVVQAEHLEITVLASERRIVVRKLTT